MANTNNTNNTKRYMYGKYNITVIDDGKKPSPEAIKNFWKVYHELSLKYGI